MIFPSLDVQTDDEPGGNELAWADPQLDKSIPRTKIPKNFFMQ